MAPTRFWDHYIFNTLPLPHTVLLCFLLIVTLRIAINFHFHHGARPILTLCVVASILASISDTLAQMIEVTRARTKAAAAKKVLGKDIGDIELDEKTPSSGSESPGFSGSKATFSWTTAERPLSFDFPRMIRFMGYGFFFAPIAVHSLFGYRLMVVLLVWIFR